MMDVVSVEIDASVGQQHIEKLIFSIRGVQVLLDSDLAALYGVETKYLNRQVKRNIERFPDDFMFQLTKEEFSSLRCQFVTANREKVRYLPYAFTENGVAMLSGVLRSKTAISVNINIMRAFTSMRGILSTNTQVFKRIEAIEYHQLEMDKRIDVVFNKLENNTTKIRQGVFFDGQIFDAYAFVSDLIKKAKHNIVLIDNYIDESVLTLLNKRNSGVDATIYTAKVNEQLKLDLERNNAQYTPIGIKPFNKSHDRFLCIDEDVYHIGASIKDLGKKWFAFSKMDDFKPNDLTSKIKWCNENSIRNK